MLSLEDIALQLQDGKVGHGIAFPAGTLCCQVLFEDRDVVRVVSVHAINEGLNDFGAIRRDTGDASHVAEKGRGGGWKLARSGL